MDKRSHLRGFSQKSSKTCADAQTNEISLTGDELVKYMSKLPGYLERGQDNAFNVGVLDWARLEKWKHSRERYADTSVKTTLPNASNLHKVKASRDLQHSLHGVTCTLEPRDSFNNQEIATCSYKSSHERVKHPGKSRSSHSYREPTSGLLSKMGNSGGSLGAKEAEKRAGEIRAQEERERALESWKQCVDGEEKTFGGLTSEKQVTDIVLLRSRKQSRITLSGEPQTSLDDNLEITRGLGSQIPRSCPLSFDIERDSEDMMLPLGTKERFGGTRRHSKTASRIFDQEIRQDESGHTSPSKRFSFSRSFTFKEDSSAGQPFSSCDDTIKYDYMTSQSSNPEKQNARVSPLRRLLDPLLKSRPTCSNPKAANMNVPAWRTRALFQLTIRNGIPLFQFVVDDNNSRSILGATMKSCASSFKEDSVQYCTFYSVNEVKKKRSGKWLIHAHKEKQRGFVYNVIGQMQLCNSEKSESISSVMMRESVLVDESEQVKGRKEVAAVVIKKKQYFSALGETTVIIPGGVHSVPEKGAPTPLISRWRSGGSCDCGGWDVGCKLHVLSNKTFQDQSFKLFDQEESDQNPGPVLEMLELKTGIYSVEFGSVLSHLQAFFVCVTLITCASEEEQVSKTTGKSSSPFAPPLSPVGRA